MTHLGNAISRLMLAQPKLTGKEIAVRAGVDPSYVSRLIKGQGGVSPESLAKIAQAIGRNTIEKAEIIAAHMKDESCGFYPDLIDVEVSLVGKSSDLHPDIEYLQSHLNDSRIRDSVRAIVALHKGKSGNKAASDGKR